MARAIKTAPILETDRLRLRPFRAADLRALIDRLKIHKVEALIRRENKPSAALAKRLGFRLEGGPIPDRWRVAGKWHSVMLYGLVASEEK